MNSRELFVKQIGKHAEVLAQLLTCPSDAPAPSKVMERCISSTRMLVGTSELMGYEGWQKLLAAYQRLAERYHAGECSWDERIAQVTSELIEREEGVAYVHENDPKSDIASVLAGDEVNALVAEIDALEEEAGDTTTRAGAASVNASSEAIDLYDLGALTDDPEDGVALDKIGATAIGEDPVPQPKSGHKVGNGPLHGILAELEDCALRLFHHIGSEEWRLRKWGSPRIESIRHDLSMIDFYARSVNKIIRRNTGEATRARCTLTALATALADFGTELSYGAGREVTIVLEGEDHTIDPQLLPVADSVLQAMIRDAFERCEGDSVRVTVTVSEKNGALRWLVCDDGDNFLSDSRLDNDDHLAFYPGLRNVIHALSDNHGVLWVEPADGRRARFEFTLPVTREAEMLLVWGENQEAFSVRLSQLCDMLPEATDTRRKDTYGEYLDLDHRRVPLLRLDTLFAEAPSSGSMIAVIGTLEKRIAFYVPDCGERHEGQLAADSFSLWTGEAQPVAMIGSRRVPLLQADRVLATYHSVIGTMSSAENSGGVLDNDSDDFRSQARSQVDTSTPPEAFADPEKEAAHETGVDVLVVEQSDAMKDALSVILEQSRVTASFASCVEEAMLTINARAPRLIISEFRMPTMAAKQLVETLRNEGKLIPVLVTTAQSGKTADMLVEKLGVSGYLSKPLHAEQVTAQVNAFLAADIAR